MLHCHIPNKGNPLSNLPAQMYFQPVQAWSSYWLKLSQLMWSSGDVIARRGMLYAGSDNSARLNSDFDGMASEKSKAAVESWMAMMAATAQLAPGWGIRLWQSALMPAKTPQALGNQMVRAALDNTQTSLRVAKAGMRPLQKQVTSNVTRLKARKKK